VSDLPPSLDLGAYLARAALPLGWRVLYQREAESTMVLAREGAAQGWPDRSVFVCDYQTAGRGREGRRWEAPPGLALLFTLLRRHPGLPPTSPLIPSASSTVSTGHRADAGQALSLSKDPLPTSHFTLQPSPFLETMLASVALCETIERLLELRPRIKWPNDLLIDDQKLAGVLAESCMAGQQGYTLVGCGLNVNQSAGHLLSVGQPATSLKIGYGREVHRGELLVLFIQRFEAWLGLPAERRVAELPRAWEARLWRRGELAQFRDGEGEFQATIVGLAADGSLLVRLADGRPRTFASGELAPTGAAPLDK
jgi:BirA family biotin operon repressor/biotin-[acetyl-CoA-carboxylase] ligase